MKLPFRSARRPFALLAALLFALALASHSSALAETPAAPVPPAAQPVPPVAPPEPVPAAPNPAPLAARRPEDEPGHPAATQPAAPSVFARAAALVKGKDALAAQIAGLEKDKLDLTSKTAADALTIAAQNTELLSLRAGRDALQAALTEAETEKTTVAGQVAAIGFPTAQLPAPNKIDQATATTEDALLASFRAEQDPGKKAGFWALIEKERARTAAK